MRRRLDVRGVGCGVTTSGPHSSSSRFAPLTGRGETGLMLLGRHAENGARCRSATWIRELIQGLNVFAARNTLRQIVLRQVFTVDCRRDATSSWRANFPEWYALREMVLTTQTTSGLAKTHPVVWSHTTLTKDPKMTRIASALLRD